MIIKKAVFVCSATQVVALLLCGCGLEAVEGDDTDKTGDSDTGDAGETNDEPGEREYLEPNGAVPGDEGDIYFSLRTGEIVDASRDDDTWDLAFSDWYILTNGGVSGNAAGGGMALCEYAYEDVSKDTLPPFNEVDGHASVFEDWFETSSGAGGGHILTSLGYTYLIRKGDTHYKLEILSYYGESGGAPVSALFHIRYAEIDKEGVGSIQDVENINGTAGGMTAKGDAGYFSFDNGKLELTDEEAEDSTSWDIRFKRHHIALNSGGSGPGDTTGYVLEDKVFDEVDWSDVPDGDAFTADRLCPVVDAWAEIGPSGDIAFDNCVYIILSADGVSWFKFYPLAVTGGDDDGYETLEFRFDPL